MTPGRIRVGISGWRYPPWRGDFYPKGLPQRRELEYAASRLSSIEINGSFYSLQRETSWLRWRAEVPDDFVFAVKGGRYITHMLRLREVEQPLRRFFDQGVLTLGPKLGPILWQLPASFTWDAAVIREFCALLPRTVAGRPLRHALEPRSHTFASEEALAVLAECDVALVVADSAGKFPRFDQAIGPLVYARLHGDQELYASGYSDRALDRWAEKLRSWTADGRDAFVYFDNDVKGFAPWDAMRLTERLAR